MRLSGIVVRCFGTLFIAMLLGGAPRLGLSSFAHAQPFPERKSIAALTDVELMSLRRGVATMMQRNSAPRDSADFRRSWVYWANMHGHFGSSCRGPITGTGMETVQEWTASNANETTTWCKCEHKTDHFPTWHRMYMWYFERVLQQAANDAQLRVPYWDYATDPLLPAAFRDTTYVDEFGQSVPNPLRVEQRKPTLNNGSAGIASGARTATNAMSATTYATFRSRLEGTPHGSVHCAVGSQGCGSGLMGFVPTAALDPIFYLHHSNIDRLYECWLKVNEAARLPKSTTILNKRYSFVDADGTVKNRRVRDMLKTSQLGYSYTPGGDCPVSAAPAVVAAAGVTAAGPTSLGSGLTSAPVTVESGVTSAFGPQARGRASRTATLVIEGFQVDEIPSVLYNVYIEAPGFLREQVGVIEFFGFASNAQQGGHGGHGGRAGRADRIEFDATVALERMRPAPGVKLSVVLEPTTGLTDSSPSAAAKLVSPRVRARFERSRISLDP